MTTLLDDVPEFTKDDWKEAVRLRTDTDMTTAEIAAKFPGKINENALAARFSRHGIKKSEVKNMVEETAREALKEGVREVIQKSASEMAGVVVTKSKLMEEQGLTAMGGLQARVLKVIQDTEKNGRPYADMLDDMKALNMAMRNLGISREYAAALLERYEELDDSELPALEIVTIGDEEVARMREEQALEDAEIGDGGAHMYGSHTESEDEDGVVEINDVSE